MVPTCEGGGPLYEVTTTVTLVEHITAFEDGRQHETFTETGTFTATPLDSALPRYTGRLVARGTFNTNGETETGSFTFSVRGTGSDGSTFSHHETFHLNVRPDGTVHEFFHCHD